MKSEHTLKNARVYAAHAADRGLTKRAFDLGLAIALLCALSPLMLAIAIAIKLDSSGRILYAQPRVGLHGRIFRMFKFRTMRAEAGDLPAPTVKLKDDPRVTRVGRVLRRLSLDELPQLINILAGEMSFVGPRPELLELVAEYGPDHHLRHQAVPGLTGWWQVHGRCERPDGCTSAEDLAGKLADDVYYLQHQSLWLDLRILALTVPVIIHGRGAI